MPARLVASFYMIDTARFDQVQREWAAIVKPRTPDGWRFAEVKAEAEALVQRGLWVSGPSDMLSVLGRSRDELMHSRLLAWLLVPTNRHGLGRGFLTAFADRLWPNDGLLRTGTVTVDTEESGSAVDEEGALREARADIVIRGEGVTIVIENKLDAGEQPAQCERLYWGWAAQAADARYVFLTPSGRAPTTAETDVARSAWQAMSYGDVRAVLTGVLEASPVSTAAGRETAGQYLHTLRLAVAPLT